MFSNIHVTNIDQVTKAGSWHPHLLSGGAGRGHGRYSAILESRAVLRRLLASLWLGVER